MTVEYDPQSRRAARLVTSGAVLLAAGGVVGFIGVMLAAVGTVTIARRRIEQMDVPPKELARRQLKQAKAAVGAGAAAWRDELAAGSGKPAARPE